MPGVPRDTTRRIGLLGGSFNPAHDGHRHISLEALRLLGLDEVWWLVSPQNPLKSDDGMEPLATRLARARKLAAHRRIRVEAPELSTGTRYTDDTVAGLNLPPAIRVEYGGLYEEQQKSFKDFAFVLFLAIVGIEWTLRKRLGLP